MRCHGGRNGLLSDAHLGGNKPKTPLLDIVIVMRLSRDSKLGLPGGGQILKKQNGRLRENSGRCISVRNKRKGGVVLHQVTWT